MATRLRLPGVLAFALRRRIVRRHCRRRAHASARAPPEAASPLARPASPSRFPLRLRLSSDWGLARFSPPSPSPPPPPARVNCPLSTIIEALPPALFYPPPLTTQFLPPVPLTRCAANLLLTCSGSLMPGVCSQVLANPVQTVVIIIPFVLPFAPPYRILSVKKIVVFFSPSYCLAGSGRRSHV